MNRSGTASRVAIVRSGGTARLWSRQSNDLTDRFPDVAKAAVRQLPDGVVLDGGLVILVDGRLSAWSPRRPKARPLVASTPASYVAFDLLAIAGVDLRAALDRTPYPTRRPGEGLGALSG